MRRSLFVRLSCIIIGIYLVYCYMFFSITPPPYDRQAPPKKYQITNSNFFYTVPNYLKSKKLHSKRDVTLVTQVSVDRLSKIKDMAEAWLGPMSVAVYVKNSTEEAQEDELTTINKIFNNNPPVRSFVDFHLLYANRTRYPVNNLRNLALKHARTHMVMILDADFIPSPDMHGYLSNIARQGDHTKRAYVIPAFSSDLSITSLPKTKPLLVDALRRQKVAEVNTAPCPKCHGPTDYQRWYTTAEPYDIQYRWIYEPYLMFNKDELPELFDERLKGYGFDKNTHVFALAASGYRFTVLPDHFVIHLNHEVATWDGGTIQDQLWDALTKVVCQFLVTTKTKYGHDPNKQLFDEPLGSACFSRDHW